MAEHQIKEQTKKHVKRMKKLVEELQDAGFDMDEVVDAGDYYLNSLTLEQLKGETSKATNKKSTKSDSKLAKQCDVKTKKKKGKGKKGK